MEYIEFAGTIADLKILENLVGLEITVQLEAFAGQPRKRFMVTSTTLVGHVNADDGGCCGCCSSWRDNARVLRYRRVYDPNTTPADTTELLE